MTAVLRREIALQEEERSAAFAAPSDIKRGEITEVDGSIEGDLPYLVWVKPFEPNANPLQVLNPGTIQNLQVDMPVFYRQDPEAPALWSLVDFDEGTFASDAATFLTLPGLNSPPHAVKHIMAPGNPGPDPLNVYSHAMVDFAVRPTQPTSMKVRVSSGWYPGADNYEFFTGPANSKDFTSDIPASAGKSLIIAIGVDKTGTLVYTDGTEYVTGEPVPDASWPVVPATRLLISAIRLDNGMTIIQNENFDHEMRPVFAPGGLARANRLWELDSNSDTIRPVDNEFVRMGLDEQDDANIADHWFEIISEGSNPHAADVKYNATAATGVLKNIYRAKGSQSSPGAVVDNDIIFDEQFYGYADTGVNWFQVAQMRVEIDGVPSGDDIPGSIVFEAHTPGDPGGNLTERLRLSPTEVLVNGQQEEVNFRFPGSLGEDNVFFISGLDEFVGFGTGTSSTGQQVEFLMKADRDILIDGATNERTVDTGVMRFEQTPAITNTRAVTVNIDINSQENSHAVVVNALTTQLQAGESISCYDINIDAANAGGGVVRGFEMSCVDPGGVLECHALHVDPDVSPVFQLSGSFISVEQGWQDAGGFTDTTVAFNSGATDINVFVSNGDVLYWGMAATFTAIEVDLNTNASGAGIKPTFEFSDGIGGWTTFTPSDESQGFRQSGVISWVVADLSGWAQDTVNGVGSKFWIRITRTAVALTTPPNEETLKVAATTEYQWDEDGIVTINNLIVEDAMTHRDDADNKIAFTDDKQTYTVGGLVALQLSEAAQDLAEIGDVAGTGDWDVNFNNGQMLLTGSSGVLTLGLNEVPVIVDSVTKTVRAAGGDFTTIQGAINFFKNKLIVGSCVIDVESATYAESVSVVDLFIGATGSLKIQGDTRVLAGQSYVDGAETNTSGLANGGTGVFTLTNAGNDITITGATTNPDFDADGWGNGDKILTYDNAGAVAEHTISSTLNNVITLTGAAPALGNDATAIMLQPDRNITGGGFTSLTVDLVKGVQVTGFYLTGQVGVTIINGAFCTIRNCATRPVGNGFVVQSLYSVLDCGQGSVSSWDANQAFRSTGGANLLALASVAVGSTVGYRCQIFSVLNAQNGVGVNCTTAFDTQIFANLELFAAYARQNTTGYKAQSFSFIRALSTSAKNNGNGTDYNPAVSGVHGNNGAMIQWT